MDFLRQHTTNFTYPQMFQIKHKLSTTKNPSHAAATEKRTKLDRKIQNSTPPQEVSKIQLWSSLHRNHYRIIEYILVTTSFSVKSKIKTIPV